jgi:transaldolase/glucose-6-phosphate isomerase
VAEVLALETLLDEELRMAVDDRLRRLADDDVIGRIWARDHTVWRDDPAEISDRLGWLTAPNESRRLITDLRGIADEAAADGLTHAVLLGMGGSSLAPEVFSRTLGTAEGMLELVVLDSTHPDAVARIERDLPVDRVLFVVSSKSGTTIETRSHLAHFHALVGDGSRFAAVTDPGTPLEATANELGFRRVFHAPPDVGGRYSALTVFGLLPAALIGADLDGLLGSAAEGAAACGEENPPGANLGAALGAIVGEAAARGRDKLTLLLPGPVSALGAWTEQLVAESTGKEGSGILPVDGEPAGSPDVYGDDRLFLALGDAISPEPYARLPLGEPESLGAAMFILEFATAVAGHVLGIHPFDQPDVQAAKDRTSELLRSDGGAPVEAPEDPGELLASVSRGDYVAIQAFVPPSEETWGPLQAARVRIRDRLQVATTLGYGPRYLHSTGQLHKGGPNTGVFLQLFDEPKGDVSVPGQPYTFGQLIAAQAAGDLAALRERGRRAGRVTTEALVAWDG